MGQLTLSICVEPEYEPLLELDPPLREELVAVMKLIVITIHKAGIGGNDDELS